MKTLPLSTRKLIYLAFAVALLSLLFISCQNQSKGFVLPEGDIAQGKQAFVELNCNNCHSIQDIAWTGDASAEDPNTPLGGPTSTLKTYGELVTSIINPSHKISAKYAQEFAISNPDGSSKMERFGFNYNYAMSVQELVDVVTFLQSEYKLVVPKNTYPY